MIPSEVVIPFQEIESIRTIAEKRNSEQRKSGQRDGLIDKSKGSVTADIEGALGEYAVARGLNLPWDGAFKSAEAWQSWRVDGHDVSGLEVRATRHETGRLIVQPWNSNEKPYILVVLRSKETEHAARLVGWCWGHEAKQEKNWMNHWPRPCFAVAQADLHPMDTLLVHRVRNEFRRCLPPSRLLLVEGALRSHDGCVTLHPMDRERLEVRAADRVLGFVRSEKLCARVERGGVGHIDARVDAGAIVGIFDDPPPQKSLQK